MPGNLLKALPDDTRLYSGEEFRELLERQSGKKVLVRDSILLLLCARAEKPIYGRIMMMKQLFLFYEEILENFGLKYQNPRFVPYKYGPYSFMIMQVIEDLYFAGYLTIQGRRNSRKEQFLLTEKGLKEIIEKYKTLPEGAKKAIEELRVGWDQLGTQGILNYVYTNYPRYKEKSEIKEKYKEIEWGKGRA